MPKRKKLPPIPNYENGGRDPNRHLIQKSNPLLSLSQTDMTLPELKILDAYLDRIDSHDETKRTAQFEKGWLENLLGVSRILKPDLEKRLYHLAQVVKIEDETKPKGFKLVSLFEEIDAWQDENGLWQISLTCTDKAREYIFNVDNIGYLRYRLKSVISLTSRYSYVLYLYLEYNRFRRSWEIDLSDLKSMLRCTADTYKQFYRFNDLVLKKCQKELLEKTNCQFTYEPIKRGRSVKSVRFVIKTLPAIGDEDIPEQSHLDESNLKNDYIEFLQSACSVGEEHEPEFSRAEMEQIFKILVVVPESKLPLPESVPTGSIDFRRYHYLAERYAAMIRADEKKSIKNRFAYFVSMIKRDAGIEL